MKTKSISTERKEEERNLKTIENEDFEGVIIYEGAMIGENVKIGRGTIIFPNVVH
jgi:acetyltransferase-like isoleucine patch superfamily enzyme